MTNSTQSEFHVPPLSLSTSLICFSALGQDIAVEKNKIVAMLKIGSDDVIVCHGRARGLVTSYCGDIIPVVDCRQSGAASYAGSSAMVAKVLGKKFMLLIDRVSGSVEFSYLECIEMCDTRDDSAGGLIGRIWKNGQSIYVVDLDLMMGPVIKQLMLT
jgi:hypothetical protein